MTLTLLVSIAQLITAIAVVASVIYLAAQTRGHKRTYDLEAYQLYLNDMQRFRALIASDEEVARLYSQGSNDMKSLTEVEQWRFGALMLQVFQCFHTLWTFQDKLPLVTRDLDATVLAIAARRGAQTWWRRGRDSFSPEFAAYIDGLMATKAAPADAGGAP